MLGGKRTDALVNDGPLSLLLGQGAGRRERRRLHGRGDRAKLW